MVCATALVACGGPSAPESPTLPESASPSTSSPRVTVPTLAGDVVTGLQAPWSVVPLTGGRALISERDTARVLLLEDGKTRVIDTLPDVRPGGEGGLLGMAVPSPQAHTVYAYFTADTDNRVVAYRFDGQQLTDPREVLTGIPKGMIHNGGRLAFGPDGFLYISTGETGQPQLAQDRASLAGKILRVTRSGRPAPGNPDPASAVWSYGHRNVQGLAWDTDGRLWATEFGQEDTDELNLIEPGNNYGWPQCEGDCDLPGTTNPKATWSPTSTSSPSGLAIVAGSAWVAALRGQTLFQVPLNGTTAGQPVAWFAGQLGRLRDVVQSPSGGLWVVTNNTDGRGTPQTGDDRIVQVDLP